MIGFLRPHLLKAEEEFIRKNTFQLTYEPFDWRLNDLTGGRPTSEPGVRRVLSVS